MRRLALLGTLLLWPVPLLAQQGVPGPPVLCTVVNTSTTTLVAFGDPCVSRDPQVAIYITEITASSSVISSTSADVALELKYGTGTNCGTGTTLLWAAYSLALDPIHASFRTPLKVPAGKDLCWMHAGTGSKTFIISGYQGAP